MNVWYLDLSHAKQMASYRVRCTHENNKLDTLWINVCLLNEKLRKWEVGALIRLCWMISFLCFMIRNVSSSDFFFFLSYFTTSQYPLPEEFSSLSAHLLLLPPVSSCVVSAHWDMLFGLIYNASPAPGHHVWQMTYFCADPHRALTWGGWVGVCASVRKSVYVCLFVYQSTDAVHVRKWHGEGRLCFV